MKYNLGVFDKVFSVSESVCAEAYDYLLYLKYDVFYRSLVSKLRRLEKETYLVRRALNEDPDNPELESEMLDLETLVSIHSVL